jgi:adenylate cyclase
VTVPLPVVLAAAASIIVLAFLLRRERTNRLQLSRRLERAASELQSLQAAFSRFAPDAVVERVIAHGVRSEGEKREVTALFADLVGFTALAESVEPVVLMRILNGYFERMSRAITSHRGYVSTFIGDGILALFGALEPNPWQSDDAAHAALGMREELAHYDRELDAEGLPTLSIGIGLHRGVGVAGLVGSRELMQFALVGRTVNVAARVEELTRQLGASVIVTDAVRGALDSRFRLRTLPPTSVKGVDQPLVIFALEGFDG